MEKDFVTSLRDSIDIAKKGDIMSPEYKKHFEVTCRTMIIRYFFDIAIPAVTAYLASSDSLLQFLIKHNVLASSINISLFQDICLFINIVFTTFILCFRLIKYEFRQKSSNKKISGLYNMVKKIIQSNLCQISGDSNISFDLRIFVPKKSFRRWIKSLFSKNAEKWFIIRNVEPFASRDVTEHLEFRVEPNPQGLVGSAYTKKSIVYDDNLSETNSTAYSLDQTQVSRTSSLLWSICIPILNENNDVIAIMALDSNTSDLDITANKDAVRRLTNTIAIMMRDSVPELFKSKVGF